MSNQALAHQEGGDHYKRLKIQPIEYIHANGIPFAEGSVIKYVTRWRDKGGIKDLEKARHFIDLLIELETRGAEQ
jgi:UDP-3-O-acyl-N-acetylglucosamine deacetylase